jgi:hypothetical protein
VQRLTRIPKSPAPVSIERVRTPELAALLGKVTRTRPVADSLLRNDAQKVLLMNAPNACSARISPILCHQLGCSAKSGNS